MTSCIIFNKYMEINIIIFITLITVSQENLHLDFSGFGASFFINSNSRVALGSQSRRASAEPKHPLNAVCVDLQL